MEFSNWTCGTTPSTGSVFFLFGKEHQGLILNPELRNQFKPTAHQHAKLGQYIFRSYIPCTPQSRQGFPSNKGDANTFMSQVTTVYVRMIRSIHSRVYFQQ